MSSNKRQRVFVGPIDWRGMQASAKSSRRLKAVRSVMRQSNAVSRASIIPVKNGGIKPTMNLAHNGPEQKFVNVSGNDQNIPAGTASVTAQCLNLLVQGTDQQTRLGDKIRAISIDVHAILKGGSWTTVGRYPGSMIRWWVMVDTQPDGAAFTTSQWLFQSSSYNTSHNNPDGSERFKTLRSGTEYVSATANNAATLITPSAQDKKYLSINVQLNDGVRYKGNAGTIADIQSGAYYFCYCADGNPDVVNTISFDTMFKFTDE